MQSVTHVLTNEDAEEEKTEEDQMIEEIQRSGKQPNVSMIAFTATPKPDTIQLFGTLNESGNKESFDVYSMKQAIEEGYILNVLNNYVTWKTCVQDALVYGFDQNVDFYTLLLENQTVRDRIASVFRLEIYNMLVGKNNGGDTDKAGLYLTSYEQPVSMVAEEPTKYGKDEK